MLRTLILLLALISLTSTTQAGEPKCFATWSEADLIVRQEKLVAIEQVSSLPRFASKGAEVVKSTLCQEEAGRYVYRLLVRGPKGHLRLVSLDARKPDGE